MEGQGVLTHILKRSDQAVTMAVANAVKVNERDVEMDPRLIWQRWCTGGLNSGELADTISHELNVYAPSLFESRGIMLTADKASLSHYLAARIGVKDSTINATIPIGVCVYVIDGCAQLFRIKWQKG